MNIDRGKESFTEAEIAELRTRIDLYREVHGLTWKALSARVEVPMGTLSQWVPNKYPGDNAAIAYKINKFIISDEASRQMELDAPETPGFQLTQTARQIMGQLQWARRGNMVVVCGRPGVGKTSAARQFVASTPNAWLVRISVDTASPTGMLSAILRSQGDNKGCFGGLGGMRVMTAEIMKRITVPGAVLVMDEVQLLADLALEQLRCLHDGTGAGIALVGNPKVLARVQGGAREADFAQFSSRLSLGSFYDKPFPEDVETLLDAWRVETPAERKFMATVAAQHGALRALSKVMELATLIAAQEGQPRALDHLKGAWQQHKLRPVAA